MTARGDLCADLLYRRAQQQRHPVFVPEGYTLKTSALAGIQKLICAWLELGKSGLTFGGLPRAGKTMVIKATIDRLEELFPDVAFVFLTSELESRSQAPNKMYTDCLEQLQVGHRKHTLLRPFNTLANHLMSRCIDRGGRCCVIFLDEAQKLSADHWTAMGILWNRVALNGFRLCVYSFGNDELIGKADIHERSKLAGVGARFLVKNLEFDGVRTLEELTDILRQYDEALWYPTVEWPYTRYFAQQAYDLEQWRLENQASRYWDELCAYAGLAKEVEIKRGFCMQWVTDPIHYVLKECINSDLYPDERGNVPWSEAIEATCPAKIC